MLMDVDRLLEQMEREDQFRSPGLLYTEEIRFLLGLGPKVEDNEVVRAGIKPMSDRTPPTAVYFVERIPPEDESAPYYGRRLARLYSSRSAINAFIGGNKHKRGSRFRVWKAEVTWTEEGQP